MEQNSVNNLDEVGFDVKSYPGGLKAALEAILIVVSEPQIPEKLAKALAVREDEVQKALEELSIKYREQECGFELKEFDNQWRFYCAQEFFGVVSKYLQRTSESKLSQAALETLAIIAYKQPTTRSQVASIRGVSVDGVFRTLLTRGLIEKFEQNGNLGIDNYITTSAFLEKLGITSLDELEPLAPYLPEDITQISEFDDFRKKSRTQNDGEEENV
ncbi:MAG: SMC-Scp complex subunit ScpB [Candidatus Ancillula sp.]|nr:SMC-Scp complex subunit ScpB [Candidatus Ancillula sp.]